MDTNTIVTLITIIFLLMLLLQTKHFVIDFLWQTQDEVMHKGIYGNKIGAMHSFKHAVATFLIFGMLSPTKSAVLALLDFILHYHIDWAKMNINYKFSLTPKDSKFWNLLGLDQFLHQLTYVLLIYLSIIKWG